MCQLSISILDKKATYIKLFLKHTMLCVVLSRSVGPTLCDLMACSPPGSSVHRYSPGKNTGVGCHFPLHWNQQRIAILGLQPQLTMCKFPPQDPGLLHCRRILYQLSHKGSPRILEWVAYPVSSGSSQPRNPTGVSCIAGEFFTN